MGRKYYDQFAVCVATGEVGCDLHHVKTRGSGGLDEPWNLIPVSHAIHMEIHSKGLVWASLKYPGIRTWLLEHGWFLEEQRGKWKHDRFSQ